MNLLQIKMGQNQPIVDNPNFIDCFRPEDAVCTQTVLDMLNINHHVVGLLNKDTDNVFLRYYTDVNLTDGVRQELQLMFRKVLSELKKTPDDFAKFLKEAERAFSSVSENLAEK
jgi:hypothetical protein